MVKKQIVGKPVAPVIKLNKNIKKHTNSRTYSNVLRGVSCNKSYNETFDEKQENIEFCSINPNGQTLVKTIKKNTLDKKLNAINDYINDFKNEIREQLSKEEQNKKIKKKNYFIFNPAKNIYKSSEIDKEVNKLSKLLSNSLIIKYFIENMSKIDIDDIEFNICISGFKYRKRNNDDNDEIPKKKTPKKNSPRRIGLIAYRTNKYTSLSSISYKHHIKRYKSKGFVTNIFYDPSITTLNDFEIYKKIIDYINKKSNDNESDDNESDDLNNERFDEEKNYYWNDEYNEEIEDDKKTKKHKKGKKVTKDTKVEEVKEVEKVEKVKGHSKPAPWSKKSNDYDKYKLSHEGYDNMTNYNKTKWANIKNNNNNINNNEIIM
jgi:hypothetical protein